ncbi:Aste57867_10795 [Aphanomyces stellatus]|uniref:Aste57867_10795 protein n=1 Tax=Aphanomyces stellatus TaxID=120398 RepID=A0A485KSF7_9STRA|nr:hypothetical protein As57867_010755 [Aphanomyces stellatus]VFT87664.1 Aste57867_10795 [Aphanomyces stellatus]
MRTPTALWTKERHVQTKKPGGQLECCRRQPAGKPVNAWNYYDGIIYRFVDGSLLERLSTTVGGHRIPYRTAHVKLMRLKHDYQTTLAPIQETAEKVCERCHSNSFSNHPKTKCITLTTRSKNLLDKPVS